jgi:hypothetical protein
MNQLPQEVLFIIFTYCSLNDVMYSLLPTLSNINYHQLANILFTSRYQFNNNNTEWIQRQLQQQHESSLQQLNTHLQQHCFELLFTTNSSSIHSIRMDIDWLFNRSIIEQCSLLPIFYNQDNTTSNFLFNNQDVRVKGLLFQIQQQQNNKLILHILVHEYIMNHDENITLDDSQLLFFMNENSNNNNNTLTRMQYFQYVYRKRFDMEAIVKSTTGGDKLIIQLPQLTSTDSAIPVKCSHTPTNLQYAREGDIIQIQGYFNSYRSLTLDNIVLLKATYRPLIVRREILPLLLILAYQILCVYNYGEWTSNWTWIFRITKWNTLNCVLIALITTCVVLFTALMVSVTSFWYIFSVPIIAILFSFLIDQLTVRCLLFYAEAFLFTLQCFGVLYSVLCLYDNLKYNINKWRSDVIWLSSTLTSNMNK